MSAVIVLIHLQYIDGFKINVNINGTERRTIESHLSDKGGRSKLVKNRFVRKIPGSFILRTL